MWYLICVSALGGTIGVAKHGLGRVGSRQTMRKIKPRAIRKLLSTPGGVPTVPPPRHHGRRPRFWWPVARWQREPPPPPPIDDPLASALTSAAAQSAEDDDDDGPSTTPAQMDGRHVDRPLSSQPPPPPSQSPSSSQNAPLDPFDRLVITTELPRAARLISTTDLHAEPSASAPAAHEGALGRLVAAAAPSSVESLGSLSSEVGGVTDAAGAAADGPTGEPSIETHLRYREWFRGVGSGVGSDLDSPTPREHDSGGDDLVSLDAVAPLGTDDAWLRLRDAFLAELYEGDHITLTEMERLAATDLSDPRALPANSEARRRLLYFSRSLADRQLSDHLSSALASPGLTVLMPHYAETILMSESEVVCPVVSATSAPPQTAAEATTATAGAAAATRMEGLARKAADRYTEFEEAKVRQGMRLCPPRRTACVLSPRLVGPRDRSSRHAYAWCDPRPTHSFWPSDAELTLLVANGLPHLLLP